MRGSWLLLTTMVVAACGGGDDGPPTWPGDDLPACETARHAYLVDALELPATGDEADLLGFDLDGDSRDFGDPLVDNSLGAVLAALAGRKAWVDVQARTDAALAADRIRLVVTVETCADPAFTLVELHQGREIDRSVDPPALVASDMTLLAAVGDGDAVAIEGHTRFPVAAILDPADDAAWVRGLRFTADLSAADDIEAAGRLGFGLDGEDSFAELTRAFFAAALASLDGQPGCPAACEDPDLADLVDAFDEDGDGAFTLDELRAGSLARTLLRPDLDLLDASGRYWPGQDGVDDSLSFGFGFHASAVTLE